MQTVKGNQAVLAPAAADGEQFSLLVCPGLTLVCICAYLQLGFTPCVVFAYPSCRETRIDISAYRRAKEGHRSAQTCIGVYLE